MKHRRKAEKCLNCKTDLQPDFEFCPKCGQENTHNYVGTGALLVDLVNNYLSFDSRFGRSILPFLFFPAKLPTAFVQGERMKYLPPVRLYLIISVIYFFVFNQTVLKIDLQEQKLQKVVEMSNQVDSLPNIEPEVWEKLSKDSASLARALAEDPELKNTPWFLSAIQSVDTTQKKLKNMATDSTKAKKKNFKNTLFGFDVASLRKWTSDPQMTPTMLMDSLEMEKNEFNHKVAEQIMKVGRNDLSIFIQNMVGNVSLMMLFLLPVFAFYLKVLYIFSKKLYIGHLIFMLYFQSFVYSVGVIDLLAVYLADAQPEALVPLNAIWIFIYIFAMFRGFYQQNYFLTFLKMNIFTLLYVSSLALFLLAEMFVSFMIF